MKKISRRTFSKTLSFGLGTLAASPKLSNLVETKREKLGVALVGLGRYSEYELAPALTNPVVREKGEAKATSGSIDFSFSLTSFHGICQRTK